MNVTCENEKNDGRLIPGVVQARIDSPQWQQLNRLERAMAELPAQPLPLRHIFTPGLYCRTIFMAAGTIATTRIHLFEHPFVISQGVVDVRDDENGWQRLSAPHIGVTKAGTRRVLCVVEDCVWSTFHVTDETDPEKIGEKLVYNNIDLGHLDGISADQMDAIKRNQNGTL